MAHADAIRVNQSLNHQSQLLFGYGKQRHQSPISQATPHDVRLRSILRWKRALKKEALLVKPVLKSKKFNSLKYSVSPVSTGDGVVLPQGLDAYYDDYSMEEINFWLLLWVWFGVFSANVLSLSSKRFKGTLPFLKKILPNKPNCVYTLIDVILTPVIGAFLGYILAEPQNMKTALVAGLTLSGSIIALTNSKND